MQALVEYGYRKDEDGVMRSIRRPNSQRWQSVQGGFLRFDLEAGREVPIPYKLASAFEKISGLDFRKNPDCYVWLWPESEVAKIYTVARENELATRRTDKDSVPVIVVRGVPIPEEMLDKMVQAQNRELEPEDKKHWWQR